MLSLKEVLSKSVDFLTQKRVENARRQAEEVIADALEMKRIDLYMDFDRPLNAQELDLCRAAISRRGKGEPAQYIRGEVEFFDCIFRVTPDVLIPRQETEILAANIVEHLKNCDTEGKILWDVCCGSGCLGIAIKKKVPELTVILSDISPKALEVAKENAEENRVDVSFLQGDLLDPFTDQKCHFFVCNPPYISQDEYHSLDREVKDYEPELALLAKNDGLEFYQRLAQDLPKALFPTGKAWFEVGYRQGDAITSLFSTPSWKGVTRQQDWAGLDRFFFLEIE